MKQLVIAVVLAPLLVLCGCPKSTSPAKDLHSNGRVEEVDAAGETVIVTEKHYGPNPNEVTKIERRYKVAFDCKIATATNPDAKLADLKFNDRVTVHYRKDGNDFIAYKISPRVKEKEPDKPIGQ